MKYSEVFAQRILRFELFVAVRTAETNVLHVLHDATDTCVVFGYDLCLEVGFLEIFQAFDLLLRYSTVSFRCLELQAEAVVSLMCIRNDQVGLSRCVTFTPSLNAFVRGGLQFPETCNEQSLWVVLPNEIHNLLMESCLVL